MQRPEYTHPRACARALQLTGAAEDMHAYGGLALVLARLASSDQLSTYCTSILENQSCLFLEVPSSLQFTPSPYFAH